LKDFQNYFYEKGPAGSNRNTILQEFCFKNLAEGCEFMFKGMCSEINLQKELAD